MAEAKKHRPTRNRLGPGGAKALAAALPGLSQLRRLNLDSNSLCLNSDHDEEDRRGIQALADAFPPGLVDLDLAANGLGNTGAKSEMLR